MSVKRNKQKSGGSPGDGARVDTESGFYVSCLGETEVLEPLTAQLKIEGMTAGDLCQITAAEDIAAVISRVPLSEYGQEQLAVNLTGLDWVAEKGTRHEAIVQGFSSRATVIPLRFGTIFLTQDAIQRFMEQHRDSITMMIAKLRGKEEWGLDVYFDRELLLEALGSRNASVRDLEGRIAAAPPGQGYLMSKSLQALRQQSAREEIQKVLEAIAAATSAYPSLQLGLPKFSAAGRAEIGGRFAFLVDRDRFEAFRAQAETLAGDYRDLGLRMELTGPLPPYSFVDELKG